MVNRFIVMPRLLSTFQSLATKHFWVSFQSPSNIQLHGASERSLWKDLIEMKARNNNGVSVLKPM